MVSRFPPADKGGADRKKFRRPLKTLVFAGKVWYTCFRMIDRLLLPGQLSRRVTGDHKKEGFNGKEWALPDGTIRQRKEDQDDGSEGKSGTSLPAVMSPSGKLRISCRRAVLSALFLCAEMPISGNYVQEGEIDPWQNPN